MSMTDDKSLLQATSSPRLESIDFVRGLVMVIMALDHCRGYFSLRAFPDPVDLDKTFPALFMTRWITHFCAPVFVFLAGTGAFLSGTRGKTTGQLSWFLLTRGLWLAFLDVTVIRYSWTFSLDNRFIGIGVIWAIGWSMVVLAALVWLPTTAITVFGIAMIALHNTLDSVSPEAFGPFGWLWRVLHAGGMFPITDSMRFIPGYPLIPWIGVVAAGYGFGSLFLLEPRQRSKQLLGLGLALTALYLLLRYVNVYGDLRPWKVQERGDVYTCFSFLNCHKYPPSLDYLLMTLGPAITLLGLMNGPPGMFGKFFITFGRVPLFYYLLHIPLIHAAAIGLAYSQFGNQIWQPEPGDLALPPVVTSTVGLMAAPLGDGPLLAATSLFPGRTPPYREFGNELPIIYLVWIGIVLFLFPLCYWFAGVKRRHRDVWWLSYL